MKRKLRGTAAPAAEKPAELTEQTERTEPTTAADLTGPSGAMEPAAAAEPLDPIEKRRRFLINFAVFVIGFALSVLFVRYALPVLSPFVIAFIVTLILRPFVRWFANKLKLNERATALTTVLLFYILVFLLLLVPIISLFNWVYANFGRVGNYLLHEVVPQFQTIINRATELLKQLSELTGSESPINVSETLGDVLASVTTVITNFSTNMASKAFSLATAVPNLLLNILFTVISTVFMLMDYDILKGFVLHQMSDRTLSRIRTMTSHLGKLIKKYVFSYAIIMLITFCEIAIGLLIIGVPNAWLIAVLIAVFDILPVVGSGLVLMPWAIVCLFTGSIGRGIGLVILWIIVVIIRNIIEPKIVGSTVGMHPLLTLLAMILGNFIYGGIGILLFPVFLALCQSLNNEGIIHLYRHYDAPATEDPGSKSTIFIWANRMFDKLWGWLRRIWHRLRRKKKVKKKESPEDGWDGK